MTAMLGFRIGTQDGPLTRRSGVANTLLRVARRPRPLIAILDILIGRIIGQLKRKRGVANTTTRAA
jgi:hypothetical protein